MKDTISIVYMADIINSRERLSSDDYVKFRNAVMKINGMFSEFILSPLTITLGDEYQGVIKGRDRKDSIIKALDIVFRVEETLKFQLASVELRHVIYEGRIDTEINELIAHGMIGEALTNARQELTELKKGRRMCKRFSIHIQDEPLLSTQLERCLFLNESITDRWKTNDSEIITKFIETNNYNEVAIALGKDRSLMWRRQRSLWMREYHEVKNLIHDMVILSDI